VNLVVLETTGTGSEQGAQVVNLEQFVPPERQVKNIGRVGRRMPAHCTAAGKLLLAYLPPEELEQAIPTKLQRFTPHTITDPGQLGRELAQIRERDYAVAREELEEGLNAVAASVYDHTGTVVAAASIAGPAYRITPERLPRLASRLMGVTGEISAQLGYKGQ
jgi:DNA-binding IclR family transcriptional regulator